MFIYLSKKIAIPNNTRVRGVAWSYEHNFVAAGGDSGLLKVLRLDMGSDERRMKGLAAPKNLAMNQTLEGHSSPVTGVCWNEPYQKLTSSDQNGLIIVWMLYKGSWFEEMINNRNKSVVTGMAWSSDGQKICIVYEDGAIIVGSVDGNRMWGKELKNVRLGQVEWSPDGSLILFGVSDSEIHVYDQGGNFISKAPMPAIQGAYGRHAGFGGPYRLIGIKWYNGLGGATPPDAGQLAIGFDSGRIQLMRNECDENPIIFDSGIETTCIEWNYDGTLLAISGRYEASETVKRNCIKFYTPYGECVQVLKIPGKEISSCSWEKEGLRIAMAVDGYIFFANIRPDYKWCFFSSTVVYALSSRAAVVEEPCGNVANAVIFWNTTNENKHIKSVKNLITMAAYGEYCVFATRVDESQPALKNSIYVSTLIVCNSIGTPIDLCNVDFLVHKIAITSNRVIAASKESFFIWRFASPQRFKVSSALSSASPGSAMRQFNFNDYGDQDEDGDERSQAQPHSAIDSSLSSEAAAAGFHQAKLQNIFVSRNDPICCLAASERCLIVAQESGTCQIYLLPSGTPQNKFHIKNVPSRMELNNDSTKLAIIDGTGNLTLCSIDADMTMNDKTPAAAKMIDFDRRDVWDIKWASDNADMLAISEKTKTFVFNGQMEPEDPFMASGYICEFKDLTIKTVMLDELVAEGTHNEEPLKIRDHIVMHETKALKETRELLEKVGIPDAASFIENAPHQRLWRLLAESALEALDLETAEQAFARSHDFKGIHFTKRVAQLKDDSIKRAEVCAYFGNFEEAEQIYNDMDRRDLAIAMRRQLGDYEKLIELLKSDMSSCDDTQLRDALCSAGDYWADNQRWDQAVVYYEQSEAYEKLFEAYTVLENYEGLKHLLGQFSDNHPLLYDLGRTFESVGMTKEAVESFIRCRKVELAINCCVQNSEWKQAIDLAQEYDVPNIDQLLAKYAQHLIAKERHFDIVELYKKAHKINDAIRMVMKVIDDARGEKQFNPNSSAPQLKKLYCLIGLLYEEERAARGGAIRRNSVAARKKSALNALLMDDDPATVDTAPDLSLMRVLDQPWRGAEAYHYLLLAQKQLYEGYVDAAMKTALHLRDYDDLIDQEEIYTILALAACANRCFSICSKAFIKLESLESIPEERREEYKRLSLDIFTKYPPKDGRNQPQIECIHSETPIPDHSTVCPSCATSFPICIASGRPLTDTTQKWTCGRCGHSAHKSDVVTFVNCPLCHFHISR